LIGLKKHNVSDENNIYIIYFFEIVLLGPVEYLRGKRFWLFAKKEDNDMNTDLIPNTKTQQNSLTQGLWRSGIVGRRR
jgi:hypothetical protein